MNQKHNSTLVVVLFLYEAYLVIVVIHNIVYPVVSWEVFVLTI